MAHRVAFNICTYFFSVAPNFLAPHLIIEVTVYSDMTETTVDGDNNINKRDTGCDPNGNVGYNGNKCQSLILSSNVRSKLLH